MEAEITKKICNIFLENHHHEFFLDVSMCSKILEKIKNRILTIYKDFLFIKHY